MDTLHAALAWLDPLLIAPYRLPGNALAGFGLGTAVLALWCIVFGSALSLCATRLNRRRLAELRHGMEHHHKLSEAALRAGDKESYKAVNSQAHDAFGHYFSLGGAMFCVSVIPLPFALAWMDMRFAGATPELPWDAPLIGQQPSIVFWFLLLYIPLRITYANVMSRTGWFTRLQAWAATPPPGAIPDTTPDAPESSGTASDDSGCRADGVSHTRHGQHTHHKSRDGG